MPDVPLFETRTPERSIAGIVTGLTLMILEIVLVVLKGSADMPVVFSGVLF
ncbi:MAG: hypothetical protein NTZ24_15230 [Deltaproteobacteria bacterium]|nr:hypothetical protein [Deltaproteobacteria bacterium]